MASNSQTTDTAAPVSESNALMTAASAAAGSTSLESLTRPFLDVLQSITGLDSTYLTEIDEQADTQTVMFSNNAAGLDIPENLTVEYNDSLCQRALASGNTVSTDVPADYPGSEAAAAMKLQTYVTVPVLGQDDELMGTLCGASTQAIPVKPEVQNVMHMLAKLIADQWERDRLHAEAMKRAETAEGRLRERATFLAEAEHKLKSPLTLLRGWSDMLADDWRNIPDDMRENAILTLQRASRDASRQLDELLEEARSEVLSTQLDVEPVSVGELLQEVVAQLNGVATTTGHVVKLDGVTDAIVQVDREALWQVLWHLGENALKYSPNKGTITLSADRPEADQVRLTVRDEGMGLPTDIDVFEPFARGKNPEMNGIPGTGLGLHIVRNLVLASGGTVTAEPLPAGGSAFYVTLPIA